jgi:hypothetical protein
MFIIYNQTLNCSLFGKRLTNFTPIKMFKSTKHIPVDCSQIIQLHKTLYFVLRKFQSKRPPKPFQTLKETLTQQSSKLYY